MGTYFGLGTTEAILTDLYTQIAAISGMQTVDWQRAEDKEADIENYPGVYINYRDIERKKLLKDLFKNTFTVILVGWVWVAEGGDLGTAINTLILNLRTAVLADPYRNSNAYDTEVRFIATDGGSRYPQGQMIMDLMITFFSEV